MNNEPINIFGDGSQTRSFCYRDDLVAGLILMMENDQDFIGPVNIGNPGEFTIRQLAELMAKLIGTPVRFIEKPLPTDDPRQRQPDISLAKEKLGWKPMVSLEEGLQKTIEWFRGIDFEQYRPPTPLY